MVVNQNRPPLGGRKGREKINARNRIVNVPYGHRWGGRGKGVK